MNHTRRQYIVIDNEKTNMLKYSDFKQFECTEYKYNEYDKICLYIDHIRYRGKFNFNNSSDVEHFAKILDIELVNSNVIKEFRIINNVSDIFPNNNKPEQYKDKKVFEVCNNISWNNNHSKYYIGEFYSAYCNDDRCESLFDDIWVLITYKNGTKDLLGYFNK